MLDFSRAAERMFLSLMILKSLGGGGLRYFSLENETTSLLSIKDNSEFYGDGRPKLLLTS